MYLQLALVVFVLSFVGGDATCCLPDRINGTELSKIAYHKDNGEKGVKSKMASFNVDFYNRQVSAFGELEKSDGERIAFHIISNSDALYIINDKERACKKKEPLPMPEQCIPEAAERHGPFMYRSGEVSFPTWGYDYVKDGCRISMTVDIDCKPINFMSLSSKDGKDQIQATLIVDSSLTIDEDTFQIPDYCLNPHQEKDPKLPDILDII